MFFLLNAVSLSDLVLSLFKFTYLAIYKYMKIHFLIIGMKNPHLEGSTTGFSRMKS